MKLSKLFVYFTVALSALHSSAALAKPATSLQIVDKSSFETKDKTSWFIRTDLSADVPLKGAQGFGGSAGYFTGAIFFDAALMHYSTKYEAISVYQNAVNREQTPIDPGSEIGRDRKGSDSGSILAIGPGVGFVYKFFDSKDWVQMGRFGINYAVFNDQTNGLTFNGFLANLQASIGYQLGSFVLAPGVTWNLGYVSRAASENPPSGEGKELAHIGRLPIQWWSWQLALYFWF